MKNIYRLLALFILFSSAAFPQGATPPPFVVPQYLNNQGLPNAGGFLYSYVAGTSTPQSTYTDATGSVANPNPTILDANGRAQIWLKPAIGYKLVLADSSNVILWSADDVVTLVPSTGVWTTSGNNIFNNNSGFVGIGCNSTSTVAKLDVCGISSGANYLVRIDDVSSSPGINFYGNSIKLGSIAGDSSASFRVRAGNDSSQLAVSLGNVTIQDQTSGTGTTTLTLEAGAGQSTNNLFQVQNSSASNLAYITSQGYFAAPVFNGLGDSSGFTFQNYNSTFLVDTTGDVTLSGQFAIASITGSTQCLQVNSSGIVSGTGAVCGSGGGGGSPPFPDTDNIIQSSTDSTKLFKIDATTNVPTSTTITMHVPALSFTPVSEENTETIAGTKTFTANVTGPLFDATNTGTSLVFNSAGVAINGNGIINETNAGGAVIAAGYVDTALWYGMLPQASAPSAPGGGYAAMTYCTYTTAGCSSELAFWVYEPHSAAWAKVDLAGVGGGVTSIASQTGVVTLSGSNVTITPSGGNIAISIPQSVATTASVTFGNVTTGTGGTFNSQCGTTGCDGFILSNNKFLVDGVGDTTMTGQLNVIGTYSTGSCPTGWAICVGGSTKVVDTSGDIQAVNLTVTGTCTGCGGGGGVSSITGTSNQITASPSTGAVTLSIPTTLITQNFTTSSGGVFTSSASGSTMGFQMPSGGGSFYVTGAGALFASSSLSTSGSVVVNGTTVIDSSRNANNFAQVTASGTIQSSASTAFQTTTASMNILSSGNINAQTINGGAFQIGATTVIDSSRNLTNIASITTSGNVNVNTSGSSALIVGGNIEAAAGLSTGTFSIGGIYFGADRGSRGGGNVVISGTGCSLNFVGGLLVGASGC